MSGCCPRAQAPRLERQGCRWEQIPRLVHFHLHQLQWYHRYRQFQSPIRPLRLRPFPQLWQWLRQLSRRRIQRRLWEHPKTGRLA